MRIPTVPFEQIRNNNNLYVGMVITFPSNAYYVYHHKYLIDDRLILPIEGAIDIELNRHGGKYVKTIHELKELVDGGTALVPRKVEVDCSLPTPKVTSRRFVIVGTETVNEYYNGQYNDCQWWSALSEDENYRIRFAIGSGWTTKVDYVTFHHVHPLIYNTYQDKLAKIAELEEQLRNLKDEL